jgi:hypothetical protein
MACTLVIGEPCPEFLNDRIPKAQWLLIHVKE